MPFASSSFCCPNNIQPTATIDIALSRISSSFTLRRRRKRREKFVRLQLYLNVFIKFFPSLRLVFWSSLILCLMHIFVEYLLEAGRPKAFWFVMESFVFGCFFRFRCLFGSFNCWGESAKGKFSIFIGLASRLDARGAKFIEVCCRDVMA